MERYLSAAMEQTMKIQDVILRALAKTITWWQAAEIIGISVRSMRRWRARYQRTGYDGLVDRRKGRRSAKRVAVELVEKVLGLYRERYFDFNVRHFHEKLSEEHGIKLSYTWVKSALQGAGLVKRAPRRSPHRKRRPRRPLPGMMLHIDGSTHRWFQQGRSYDLIVIMDDATNEIYYAELVDQESTKTVMTALKHVVEQRGWFCSLYSDRGSHFFYTPKAGEPVDPNRLTEVGRALRDIGIQMIPSYSPQGRGRSERNFRTWQGRLPQELRLAGISDIGEANRFLDTTYAGEFNRKFKVAPAQIGTAFVPLQRQDLDRVFSIHHDRVVNHDNTVQFANHILQIEPTAVRATLAGCRVTVYEHLNETLSIGYGPHVVGLYTAEGVPIGRSTQQRKSGSERTPTRTKTGSALEQLRIPTKKEKSSKKERKTRRERLVETAATMEKSKTLRCFFPQLLG